MRRLLPFCLLIGALLMGFASAVAQPTETATVTGTVVDSTSGEPLSSAHVFIATSMIGTTTTADGQFQLEDIPPGSQRIYASMLGYAPAAVDTLVQAGEQYTLRFRLAPTVIEEEGVTVTAERDEEWYDRLEKFERLFIGTSRNADHCTLMNPEVLQFEDGWFKPFRAEAREPLVIENHALGYRVRYFLEEFSQRGTTVRWDGEPLFKPLVPKDSAEAAKWRSNRRTAYYGSLRHFLRALVADSVREEGFTLYRHPSSAFRSTSRDRRFPTDAERLIEPQPDTTLWTLDLNGRLEVIYTEEQESARFLQWQNPASHRAPGAQRSFIELNDPVVTVDPTGDIVEPYGATVYGYFAFERLANLTPQEYRPR